jgi:hypothetical protein
VQAPTCLLDAYEDCNCFSKVSGSSKISSSILSLQFPQTSPLSARSYIQALQHYVTECTCYQHCTFVFASGRYLYSPLSMARRSVHNDWLQRSDRIRRKWQVFRQLETFKTLVHVRNKTPLSVGTKPFNFLREHSLFVCITF